MKKFLAISIPVILVLCVVCAAVIYFVWQSYGKQITDWQNNLIVTPSLDNPIDPTTNDTLTDDSSTTSPEGNGPISNDVCKVLTLDVAKQLLGNDAKIASQNEGNCTYSAISTDFSSFGVLTMVITKSNAVTAKTQFETAKNTTYSGDTEMVTGLNADSAYYAKGLTQLSILKGDSWIIISGTSDKFEDEKDLAVAAAKLVL